MEFHINSYTLPLPLPLHSYTVLIECLKMENSRFSDLLAIEIMLTIAVNVPLIFCNNEIHNI